MRRGGGDEAMAATFSLRWVKGTLMALIVLEAMHVLDDNVRV